MTVSMTLFTSAAPSIVPTPAVADRIQGEERTCASGHVNARIDIGLLNPSGSDRRLKRRSGLRYRVCRHRASSREGYTAYRHPFYGASEGLGGCLSDRSRIIQAG